MMREQLTLGENKNFSRRLSDFGVRQKVDVTMPPDGGAMSATVLASLLRAPAQSARLKRTRASFDTVLVGSYRIKEMQ